MIKEKKNKYSQQEEKATRSGDDTKTPLYIYFTNATKYYLQLLVVFQLDKM